MEGTDASTHDRMIPPKEVGGDHQEDTDTLHDIKGDVPFFCTLSALIAVICSELFFLVF